MALMLLRPCQEAEAYKPQGKENPGREKYVMEGQFLAEWTGNWGVFLKLKEDIWEKEKDVKAGASILVFPLHTHSSMAEPQQWDRNTQKIWGGQTRSSHKKLEASEKLCDHNGTIYSVVGMGI